MKQRDLVHGYSSTADKMQPLFVLTMEQTCFFNRDPLKQVTLTLILIKWRIGWAHNNARK